jgi:hypothetical protein
VTAAFDWGDGSAVDDVPVPVDPSQSPVGTHSYTASGAYTITVTAGAQSATKDITVAIQGSGPAEQFDPAAHTVTEVQDHVTANPGQAQAVRDAEAAGKNRSTLLAWLDGVIAG